MSVKKDVKQAEKNQANLTRTVIVGQLQHMLASYKKNGSADDVEKAIKKAAKIISKIVIVPTPATKTAKAKTAKKAIAKKS
ncbi:MAG TPA: hypothetical protein PKM63_12480 [Panacibacter sp.]|nr:hypothetical protein [Panacibacter sp.]HNP45097.1 hypothetical protein [Panacibacter sp.]